MTLSQCVRGEEIQGLMNRILDLNTNLEDLVVLMFQIRDIQEGRGERHMFREMFHVLYEKHPDLCMKLMDLIPEFGYWKDFFHIALENPHLLRTALVLSHNQLLKDESALRWGRPMSLFAKWVPKEGKQYNRFATNFANYLYANETLNHSQRMALYRKRLVPLNAALKTVEVLQCANQWDLINPTSVPAKARKKFRAAFMNEDVRTGLLRHPTDPKRIACREAFTAFFATNRPPKPSYLRYDLENPRYNIIRERVHAWMGENYGLNMNSFL